MLHEHEKDDFQQFYEFNKSIKKFFIVMFSLLMMFFFFMVLTANAGEVDTTKAVIHHTASHDVSAKTINKWHKKRGWDGIGYHFIIRTDGTVEKGRDLSKKGAHAKGRNNWVGIALTGYDKFSNPQINSLKKLLRDEKISHIERHHRNCPGEGFTLKGLLK